MSTLSAPKPLPRQHGDTPEPVLDAYDRSLSWFDMNRGLVYGTIAFVLIAIAGIFAYSVWQDRQEAEAQGALAGAARLYERGDYRVALDGDGMVPGLLEVVDEYGSTDAGNLAHFYAGDALFRLAEYDGALEHFEAYDADDDILGASALAGRAAILESRGEYDEAGDLYVRAAGQFESAATSPGYLLSAGRSYEAAGDYGSAIEAYEQLEEDFADAPEAQNVAVLLARARAANS